jgi:hypothetical protein
MLKSKVKVVVVVAVAALRRRRRNERANMHACSGVTRPSNSDC